MARREIFRRAKPHDTLHMWFIHACNDLVIEVEQAPCVGQKRLTFGGEAHRSRISVEQLLAKGIL